MGTATNNGNGTWGWFYDTVDGPDQSQVVTIIAIDSDGGISTTTFDLVVENVTPIVTINFGTVTVTEGEVASNWGTAVDPGRRYVLVGGVNWGPHGQLGRHVGLVLR